MFNYFSANAQPFVYYQFEGTGNTVLVPSANSTCSTCVLDSLPVNCNPSSSTSLVNQYLDFHLSNGLLQLHQPLFGNVTPPTTPGITINVLLNLDPIFELQRRNLLFNLVDKDSDQIAAGYIEYGSIVFTTKNGTGKANNMSVRLINIGAQSWDYYLNSNRGSNWHLLTFVYDGTGNGVKNIYIDGLKPGIYSGNTFVSSNFMLIGSSKIPLGNNNVLNELNKISISSILKVDQIKGYLDEVAIYPYAKDSLQVYRDFLDVDTNQHYSEGTFNDTLPIVNIEGVVDTMEFPFNYNQTDSNHFLNVATPEEQLKSYPLPRFLPGHTLNRNLNFAKAMRMAGIYSNTLISSGVPNAVAMAVDIQNELSENWNYYYNFSEHIANFSIIMKNQSVSDTDNVNAAFIQDILHSGKKYPLAGILHRSQMVVSSHPNSNFHSCTNISSIIKIDTNSTNPYQTNILNPKCLIRCPFLELSPNGNAPCFVDTFSLYPRNDTNLILHSGGANGPRWSPLGRNRKVYQPDGHEMVRLFYEYMNPGNKYSLDAESAKRIKLIANNNEIVTAYNNATLVASHKIDSARVAEGFVTANFPGITNNNDLMRLYQSNAKSNIDIDFNDSILYSQYSDIDLNLPADCKFINYSVDGHDNT